MPKAGKNKINTIQSVKGMHDILPGGKFIRGKIIKSAEKTASYYNFLRINTPIVERAELFSRTVGESTDIIEKQMFILEGKGKEKLALRPEATASIARAYIENSLSQFGYPVKLFFEGPMYRHEQPQSGRFREFNQIDFEIISNEDDPIYDAQIILSLFRFLEELKIKNLSISINSIGCKNCRVAYRKQLQNFYKSIKSELCEDCVRRFEFNPLRLLDCKQEKCRELKKYAPMMLESLCGSCKTYFNLVLEYLDELSLPYVLDHHLVSGLDYYTKTVFEVFAEGIEFALGGGGRYDYLIEMLGGKHSPAVGWAAGIE